MPTTTRLPEATLVAVALFASGCATAALPPPGVAERARRAPSYAARLRVSLKGPGVRARTRALVAFRRPDALRLEIPGPAGARLVAVAHGGSLAAVFPSERAVFKGQATAGDFETLLGVALTTEEVMDLLVGDPSPRLRSYHARWGTALPKQIRAILPDGARLDLTVEDAESGVDLPAAAFDEPLHAGYRFVSAEEARTLWSLR